MKTIFTSILAATAMFAIAAAPADAAPVRKAMPAKAATAKESRALPSTIVTDRNLASIYDDHFTEVPNYYAIVTDSPSATYDPQTSNIKDLANAYCMTLDLYNIVTDPIMLPAGLYLPSTVNESLSYNPEYTFLSYYNAEGRVEWEAEMNQPIEVKIDDKGIYTITTTFAYNGQNVKFVYEGRLGFVNANEQTSAFDNIRHDVNLKMRGGIAYYQGITGTSGQGATYLNLYSGRFDSETGGMLEPGTTVAMLIGHKKFVRKEQFTVIPGHYEVSFSMNRFTWYPGREVDYMGMTMPFGSYLREMTLDGDSQHSKYGFLKSGDLDITQNEDGTYKATIDAVTNLGYTVKIDFEGDLVLNWQDASVPATVSNLTDDVDLDLNIVRQAHIWNNGIVGGCRSYLIDIGSPSGRDEELIDGGDIFRMELFADPHEYIVPEGTYTVVTTRWNSYELAAGFLYEPFKANKGYFNANGSMTGTRYSHFKENSYWIEDFQGPAEEGTIGVSRDAEGNYTFMIDIMDDGGWYIKGSWTGPAELMYNPDDLRAGIETAAANTTLAATLHGTRLLIAGAEGPASLFTVTGAKAADGNCLEGIETAGLPAGIYILRAGNQAIKITL